MPTGARHAIDTIFRPEARDRGTLLSAARPIPTEQLVEGNVNRLAGGITWLPLPDIIMNREEAECDTIYDKTPRTPPALASQPPFLLWDMVQCSVAAGLTPEWLSTVIELGLDPMEFLTAFMAMELETGSASGGLGLVGNATYTPAVTTSNPVALATAIAHLESYLATQAGAGKPGMRGVIHLTPGLLVLAKSQALVEWRDGQYRTATGHVVLGDAGHTGQAAPHGQTAAGSGQAWIYATADVWYGLGTVHGVTRIEGDDGGAFYKPHNDLRPLYERAALLAFDPHVLGAALVSTSMTVADGGSGGGPQETTAADITAVAIAGGDIEADTFHGVSLYNSHASDAALIYIRFGTEANSTPFIPVAIAAGESVNWYLGPDEGIPVGANGVHITNEGTAAITSLVGTVYVGTA